MAQHWQVCDNGHHKEATESAQTASYDTVTAGQKEGLLHAKLHYLLALSRSFTPFLTKYQMDAPMTRFLARDLTELVKSVLSRFFKKGHLKMTPEQLVKVDATNKALWVNHIAVNSDQSRFWKCCAEKRRSDAGLSWSSTMCAMMDCPRWPPQKMINKIQCIS